MKKDFRISMLSSNFAPELLGIAKYSTDLAKTLGDAGYHLTVYAGTPHYPWGARFKSSLTIEEDEFRLVRIRHYRNINNTRFGRLIFELTYGIQLIKETLFKNLGNQHLILTVSPALGNLLATIFLNVIRKIDFILILHDLAHIGVRESGFSKSKLFSYFALVLERLAIRKARAVIVISDQMKDVVRNIAEPLNVSTAVIYNYLIAPDRDSQIEISREDLSIFNDKPIIMYTGASGFKQNLENIIEACSLLEDYQNMANLVVVTSRSFINAIRKKYSKLPTNLVMIESVPDSSFLSLLQLADFLLIHERGTVKDMCLPSKIATYLNANKPILSCTSEDSATSRFLGDYSFHVQPDSPKALARVVRDISNHTLWPKSDLNLRDELMSKLNAEHARARYLECIEEVLNSSHRE